MIITAQGKRGKKTIKVRCEGDADYFVYTFNGSEDIELEADLVYEALQNHPAGGTYFPETFALKLVTALRGWFFDKPAHVDVDGELEEIPGDEDTIY